MKGFMTIGITPELAELLDHGQWSEPVQVQVTNDPQTGALGLAFRNYSAPVMAAKKEPRRAADQ